MALSHRVAYELFVGPIPDGLSVLHKCDVTLCVNPDHLFLGTQQDNMADAASKHRLHVQRLTADQVREIRALYATGAWTQKRLAERFGVTHTQISHIVRGEQWKHVA